MSAGPNSRARIGSEDGNSFTVGDLVEDWEPLFHYKGDFYERSASTVEKLLSHPGGLTHIQEFSKVVNKDKATSRHFAAGGIGHIEETMQ